MKAISGIAVYYYFVCKRKLWFFLNDINLEKLNEDVQIGKLIDENSYSRNKKNIMINNEISIDFIENKRVIHEVKKSKSIQDASIYQVKFYLYELNRLNFEVDKGVIDYPLLKRKQEVYLTEDDKKEMENIIQDINKIGNMQCKEVAFKKTGICKKCAFLDLCEI